MDKLSKPIYVTKPALPPLDEFYEYLKVIWNTQILTNNGPYHQQFEKELASYLGVNYISLFANGTLALISALQTLNISGEVITTPFSFVATTHSLWWNNIKPVFADIDPDDLNIDPKKVEAAITPKTTAILAVHVYGNPCKLEMLQKIADNYGLKLIYDAAHAFGVEVNNESVLKYGDLSILSFHATKSFNTIEGGAIVCHDKQTKKRIDLLKNFGFLNETTVIAPGINAKMNELQAAYGILQLKYFDSYRNRRNIIYNKYYNRLNEIKGIRLIQKMENVNKHSYTYFPILIDSKQYGKTRDQVYNELKENNIYGRRYFYPLISEFPTYCGLPSAKPDNLSVAVKTAQDILCLPIFPDLEDSVIDKIIEILKR